MTEFRKICPVCKEDFSDLTDFMGHIKRSHRDIPPNEIFEMGKERKWKLRS